MNIEKQKVIDKVIKLLALAEGTGHEEEAKSAKEMAATFMAKYDIKLSLATIKSPFATVETVLSRKAPIGYDAELINVVSHFNGVAYIQKTGDGRAVNVFVGTSVDIECNNYMIDILITQRGIAWKKYLSKHKDHYNTSPSEKHKVRWFFGFAFGVRDKLDSLSTLKNEKVVEFGLVPVDHYKAALAFHLEKNANVKSSKGKARTYSEEGRAAGASASINKGVSAQSGVKRLS